VKEKGGGVEEWMRGLAGVVAVGRELEVELTEASSLGMKKVSVATWQVKNGALRSGSDGTPDTAGKRLLLPRDPLASI
jgi:hypothetical protein